MRLTAHTLRAGLLMVIVLMLTLLHAPTVQTASAQDSGGVSAVAGSASTGMVEMSVLQFGAGFQASGGVRPGDWVGIQLLVHDRSTAQRSLLVRLNLPDADGDTTWDQILLPPNPDVKQKIWIYGRVPFFKANNPQFEIQAWEVSGTTQEARTARPERLVGTLTQSMNVGGLVPSTVGLFAVVSRDGSQGALGLNQYSDFIQGEDYAPRHHELLASPAVLKPADVPDRWMGLAPFNFIVWSAYGTGNDPNDLSESQAEAIRAWVRHGGHLIVILPGSGQVWTNPVSNKLFDLMPTVNVERQEGVDLVAYRPMLLSNASKSALPVSSIVQTFVPIENSNAGDAVRVLDGPDGKTVVVRRLVGSGAVTLIGFDLTSKAFTSIGGPEPDVFWHRVLGKRGKLDPLAEVLNAEKSNRESFRGRSIRFFDKGVNESISRGQSAGVGVGLAFICYAAYWVVAGLGAWALLRHRGWLQHAWMAFVTATGLFTAIAWGGAAIIRPRVVEGAHLTLLEHVYGQQSDRARSWVTLLLPWYGSATVSVGLESEQKSSSIAPWDMPTQDSSGGSGAAFPDARGYGVDCRAPATITVPTRSTVKQFQVEWSGLTPDKWGMPSPVIDDGAGTVRLGGDVKVVLEPANTPTNKNPFPRLALQGNLRHDLPGPLRSVWVVWVGPQLSLTGTEIVNLPPSNIRIVQLSGAFSSWLPGQTLPLAELAAPMTEAASQLDIFLRGYLPESRIDDVMNTSRVAASPQNIMAAAFIDLMPPPDTKSAGRNAGPMGSVGSPALARRRLLHGWDLGRWATQPCLIIMGYVDSTAPGAPAPVPYPISVDQSDPIATRSKVTGTTFVRWIYPLADSPPTFRISEDETKTPN